MIATLNEVFKYNSCFATGAFNVSGLEMLEATIEAASKLNKAVILSYASVHSSYVKMDIIGPIMVDMAKKAPVPVCVHLDHSPSLEECVKAMTLGFSSVMYDASSKPFDVNLNETAQVVKIAHSVGVSVEAELGSILVHDADSMEKGVYKADDLEKIYTNTKEAKKFVEATNVDALAIAFGTAHGMYRVKPKLDLDRISLIKNEIDIPFVMHGGSGLSQEEYQTAIKNGIRKINYYTYLSLCGGNSVKQYIENHNEEIMFHDIATVAKNAMREDIERVIKIFSLER